MLSQTSTEPEPCMGTSRASDGEPGLLGLGLSLVLAQARFGWKSHNWEGRKDCPHQDAGTEFKPLSKAHGETSVQPLHINLPP